MAGAGGVARALAPALAELGATEITVWDTDPARARALAALVGPACRAIPADRAPEAIATADGLVNATACGMAGYPASAFALPLPNRPAWAFDAVYTPVNTRFLSAARAAGARTLTGFDLFQHMALASFRALTGIAPDPVFALPRLSALRPKEEYDNA
ncbi:shikimate dehydrogenase family protein [Jhaorihella thermophila]